jgi:hypothetical protein
MPKGGALAASPAVPPLRLYPNQLWKSLTEEDRQRALTALIQIIARRLQSSPIEQEVTHEDR